MPQLPAGDLVVDASFLIAVVDRNKDAGRFTGVLGRARLNAVNLGEVVYMLRRMMNIAPESTGRFLMSQGVRVEPFQPAAAMRFDDLKAIDASSQAQQAADSSPVLKSLSVADMCCLAHAFELGLPVVTGDAHWSTLARHGLSVPVYDYRDPSLTT